MNDRHGLWFEALARDPDAFDRWAQHLERCESDNIHCCWVDEDIRARGEKRCPLYVTLGVYASVLAVILLICVIA